MSPFTIFQILFLLAAAVGAFADLAGRPWGKTAAFFGLILFCILLLVGKG